MADFYQAKVIKEVLSCAEKIVSEDLNHLKFAQICSEMWKWLNESDLTNEQLVKRYNFLFNFVDDLENNGIPVKLDLREKWNEKALKELDKELIRIVDDYKEAIDKESKEIIADFERMKVFNIPEEVSQRIRSHKKNVQQLNYLLNEWDPIGILPFEGGPKDEYQDYIDSILEILQNEKGKTELVKFLKDHQKNVYGNPIHSQTEEFAIKVLDWWSKR